MPCKMIGYRRVSTKGQAESGLGLDAQQMTINAAATRDGCVLLKTYTEAKSARKDDLENRPQLVAAIAHARAARATLVIAKLDRLARSVAVMDLIKRSGIKIHVCDSPQVTETVLDVLMAVAAGESRAISVRTREALAQVKIRGTKSGRPLGTPANLTRSEMLKGSPAGIAAIKAKVAQAYEHTTPLIVAMRADGLSMQQIAAHLNAEGYETRRGPWNAVQVHRILKRAA